ncbi:hypothetical protein [Saccharopolyspora taberi]|uniref:Uncharacterized protein n=1 Tax=Saccharopolyspora taberi TaxID=60895 RepID=A0ABN3V8C8_9PSEU
MIERMRRWTRLYLGADSEYARDLKRKYELYTTLNEKAGTLLRAPLVDPRTGEATNFDLLRKDLATHGTWLWNPRRAVQRTWPEVLAAADRYVEVIAMMRNEQPAAKPTTEVQQAARDALRLRVDEFITAARKDLGIRGRYRPIDEPPRKAAAA